MLTVTKRGAWTFVASSPGAFGVECVMARDGTLYLRDANGAIAPAAFPNAGNLFVVDWWKGNDLTPAEYTRRLSFRGGWRRADRRGVGDGDAAGAVAGMVARFGGGAGICCRDRRLTFAIRFGCAGNGQHQCGTAGGRRGLPRRPVVGNSTGRHSRGRNQAGAIRQHSPRLLRIEP